MQRGAILEPLVCQGSGTFKGLLNTVLAILGGIVGCSHEYPVLIRRSSDEVLTHFLVFNGAACHSCAGTNGSKKTVVGYNL